MWISTRHHSVWNRPVAFVLLCLVPALLMAQTAAAADDAVADITRRADLLRARGKFTDALAEYSKALKLDPTNYLALFKRGAVYMGMEGRELAAIADFTKVLGIKPGFQGALTQRAKLELKLGNLQEALQDANALSKNKDEVLKEIQLVTGRIKESEQAQKDQQWEECKRLATEGLKASSANPQLHLIRQDCNMKLGNIRGALVDLSALESHGSKPQRFQSYIKSAKLLYYVFHEYDNAQSHIQRCLKYDMDNKDCQNTFRELKQIEKKSGAGLAGITESEKELPGSHKAWTEAIALVGENAIDEILAQVTQAYADLGLKDIDPASHSNIMTGLDETLCAAFYHSKKYRDPQATKYCGRVLSREQPTQPTNAVILAHFLKVEAILEDNDDYDSAVAHLNSALQTHPDHPKLKEKLNELHMLAQRAKSKDYYKVLGLTRSASDREIRSAYREKSRQYHPDKYKGDMTPDQVDRKMAEVNEAYEVLSTPELKERFDRGDDPNNQQQPQHHHQGNPFGGGGGGAHFQHFFKQSGGGGGGGGSQEDMFNFIFKQQHQQQQQQRQRRRPGGNGSGRRRGPR